MTATLIQGFPAVSRQEPASLPGALSDVCRTIMFTDLVDFTALTHEVGDVRAFQLLRRHDAIVRRALAGHGGGEVKHTGDGIMAVFGSAAGAVACAVEIQRAFASRHHDPRLRVRIGLHAGAPIVDGGDYYGTSVQLAARLTAAAGPGRVLVSDTVRALAESDGFRFGRHRRTRCKGFPGRVSAWEVAWEQPAWAALDTGFAAVA